MMYDYPMFEYQYPYLLLYKWNNKKKTLTIYLKCKLVRMNKMIIWIIPIDYTNELDHESSLQSELDRLFKYLERVKERKKIKIYFLFYCIWKGTPHTRD